MSKKSRCTTSTAVTIAAEAGSQESDGAEEAQWFLGEPDQEKHGEDVQEAVQELA